MAATVWTAMGWSSASATEPSPTAAPNDKPETDKKPQTDKKPGASKEKLDPAVLSAARIMADAKKHGQAAALFIRQSKSGKPSVVIAIGEDAEKFMIAVRPSPTDATVGSSAAKTGPAATAATRATAQWFEIAAGAGILSRQFNYSDSLGNSSNLRAYDVPAMAIVEVGAAVYPAAGARSSYLHGLGVRGAFGQTLTSESSTGGVSRFDSEGSRWRLGVAYELPLGRKISATFGIDYGHQRFKFEALNEQAKQIVDEAPTVRYRFVRPELGGHYAVGPVRLGGTFGYLGIVDGGKTYDRFRDPSLHGLDLAATLSVDLPYGLGVRLAADYRRVFSRFDPEVGDSFVAGGALDQFVTTTLGLSYAASAKN
jgi:hypothetical protein